MKAPEKIWINPPIDLPKLNGVIDKDSIQYVRTDAFIEKACEWLESINLDWYQIREGVFSRQLVEDFKNYMKGE